MRKPVSKQALRRALEKVESEGRLEWKDPEGVVVDRIWHEIEKESYNGTKKREESRESVRIPPLAAISEPEPTPES